MNILNAGIVHTTAAACFRVQGAFKDSTENRGADFRPVKIFAGFYQQQIPDFVRKGRYLNIFIGEQAAVDVRERCQIRVVIFQIGVSVLRLGIQHAEQVNQSFAQLPRVKRCKVVMEHTVMPKNPGIFGIQTKYQTNAQLVQAL